MSTEDPAAEIARLTVEIPQAQARLDKLKSEEWRRADLRLAAQLTPGSSVLHHFGPPAYQIVEVDFVRKFVLVAVHSSPVHDEPRIISYFRARYLGDSAPRPWVRDVLHTCIRDEKGYGWRPPIDAEEWAVTGAAVRTAVTSSGGAS